MKHTIYGLLIALASLLVGCNAAGVEQIADTSDVNDIEVTLCVGKTYTILLPTTETVTGASFLSSDTKVASVDKEGVITAIGVGNCTVRATYSTASKGEQTQLYKLSVIGFTPTPKQ